MIVKSINFGRHNLFLNLVTFFKSLFSKSNELDEEILENGPIEEDKPVSEIKQDPYPLPKDFEWTVIDVDSPQQVRLVFFNNSMRIVERCI